MMLRPLIVVAAVLFATGLATAEPALVKLAAGGKALLPVVVASSAPAGVGVIAGLLRQVGLVAFRRTH